jgi:hypothetical protein
MACRYIYKGKTYEAHEFDDVLRAMPPSEASKYMPTVQSVPDAPFTKSTDAWVALALKRVIKMAVDGGYDKVAFINGEQSAERFSLDRQLDSLTYEKKANGNYEVLVEMKNDAFGTPRVIGENLTPAEVEAQVGKEILARMEAGEGEPLKLGKRTSYVLKGDGLKIEARGMRAFYDSIVPAATKTLLKKLGGGQMEMVQLPTHGETKSQWSLGAFDASTAEIKQRAPGVFQVWVPNETSGVMQVRGGNFDTRAAAEAYIGSMAKGQTLQQPGFTLTPALKEAVDDGLPLFSQTETPQFKKWFGDSKVVGADGKPLVVYHGMQSDLRGGAFNGRRIYFTADPAYASGYAPEYGEASNVVPAYLSLQNPVDYTSLGKGDVSLTDFAAYLQKRGISSEAAGISAADLRKPPPGFKPQPIWAWMHSDKLRAASIEAGYDGAVIEEIGGPGETTAYIAFRPEQIKSAIGNSGEFDSTNPDIRFSQPPGATFDSPEPSRWSDIVYELLNKQIDLKDVTKRIVASGVVLADRTNAYLRDTLFAGRVDARVKELERNHVLPLLTEMRAAGVSMKDFGTYLHARHAEERNLEMQARNLNMPNNDALSGMSTPDARAILAKASPVMARLAARVDAIIEADRNLMEISGIEDSGTVTALRNSYQHYVPLHLDEAPPETRNGRGQGYSVKGSSIKRATGSNATVDPETILAHVLAQHETTIVRAEKNLVGMAVLHMALTNPNKDWWTGGQPADEEGHR